MGELWPASWDTAKRWKSDERWWCSAISGAGVFPSANSTFTFWTVQKTTINNRSSGETWWILHYFGGCLITTPCTWNDAQGLESIQESSWICFSGKSPCCSCPENPFRLRALFWRSVKYSYHHHSAQRYQRHRLSTEEIPSLKLTF